MIPPHQSCTAILETAVYDVLGTRPFLQSRADAVRALLADFSQAPLARTASLWILTTAPRCAGGGHHRVVAGFLNAKYRHGITSLRRSGKVFVFGEKAASTPLGYPGRENRGLPADCGRENIGFSTRFGAVLK